MRNFLISKSNDAIAFPAGFIDEITNIILSDTPKLVVFSGQPGVGKTEAVKAVIKQINVEGQHIQTITSLNLAGADYQAGIASAVKSVSALPQVKDSLNIVVWDEVRGDESEFEAVDQLISKGYTVIVAIQEAGAFDKYDKPNFANLTECQGGIEEFAA
ncbi:AAA family ATPase [Psychrobacter celer]|uniref:AAA family ATPase n=1 Tax=Psychrobacter celer TaxID=306572 RepID=UPI003FD1ABC6